MSSIYNHPKTLTQFKAIKKAFRKGKEPNQLLAIHNSRQAIKQELFTIERRLSIIQFIKNKYRGIMPRNCFLIPLGTIKTDYLGKLYDARKKNYETSKPCFEASFLDTINHGRYSSRCRYTRYSYCIKVQSFGYIVNPSTLFFRIDTDNGIVQKLIKSPRGFHFAIDDNGLKIQSNSVKSMDYHFNSCEVINYNPKQMVIDAKANYQSRKEDAKISIKTAIKLGVKVCLRDSLNAGNCEAGTLAWAMRNKLNPSEHHDIKRVAALIDNPRVKITIARAIERTKLELKRGYCDLIDHVYTSRR